MPTQTILLPRADSSPSSATQQAWRTYGRWRARSFGERLLGPVIDPSALDQPITVEIAAAMTVNLLKDGSEGDD